MKQGNFFNLSLWKIRIHGIRKLFIIYFRFPRPTIPPFFLLKEMLAECFLIALLSYSYNYSIAKYYSTKNHYKIHSNQELFAYGAANIIGSFFQCFASGASSSRTMIQNKFGGQTQVVFFFFFSNLDKFAQTDYFSF